MDDHDGRERYRAAQAREARVAAWQGAILGTLLLLGTLFALYWMLMPVFGVLMEIGGA